MNRRHTISHAWNAPFANGMCCKITPFESTGVDYFEPLYVKEFLKVTGQIIERKVWVCLVTCFTVIAIHNELV